MTSSINTRTLDQQRAEHALNCVKCITSNYDGMYVSYVSALPATIVMNGLGQALVTLLAKAKNDKAKNDKDSHRLLYDHVASWLTEQISELEGDPPMKLLDKLMKNDQHVYLRAQAEAMAYLSWLKQFARAYLNEKEGQDG